MWVQCISMSAMFSPECAHSRYVRRACVLGQLVRGIRFGDRRSARSAHMRSSAFADRSFKHPATIPLRAHPPPLAIRELLYCTEAKEWTTHSWPPNRVPTWHAHSGILVSIVACIWGGSFNRCGIYGFRSAILRACVLVCRSSRAKRHGDSSNRGNRES